MHRTEPWKYLGTCSRSALNEFALSKLELASRLRKSLRADLEAMIEQLVEARVAELLMERGEELGCTADLAQESFDFECGSVIQVGLPGEKRPKRFVADAAAD